MDKEPEPFPVAPSFYAVEDSGSFTPGDFEAEYESLVAHALGDDGRIDAEERARLDIAAGALALPRDRIARMEQALQRAYERRATITLLDPDEIAYTGGSAFDEREAPATLPPGQDRAYGGDAPATLPPPAYGGDHGHDGDHLGHDGDRLTPTTSPPSSLLQTADHEVPTSPPPAYDWATPPAPSVAADGARDAFADDRPTPQAHPAAARSYPPRSEEDDLHERFEEKRAEGALDEQFCTAAVLVRRGDATPYERELHDVYRSGTLPRPSHPLTLSAWTTLLFHPMQDRTTGDIFAVIASAVLLARVSAMRRDGSLVRLDPRQRQEPEKSTISAVRAIGWCATALGLRAPAIYVDPDRRTGLEIVAAVPPVIRVGREMLAGRSALELAFQSARSMTWFREEYFICTLLPHIAFLEDVFLAAILVGAPDLKLPHDVLARAAANRDAILPVLDASQIVRLAALAEQFLANGGRTNLGEWAARAEHAACRAGLLMCGDISVAANVLAREPNGDERVRELEGFWASDAASELRRDLGIALA